MKHAKLRMPRPMYCRQKTVMLYNKINDLADIAMQDRSVPDVNSTINIYDITVLWHF